MSRRLPHKRWKSRSEKGRHSPPISYGLGQRRWSIFQRLSPWGSELQLISIVFPESLMRAQIHGDPSPKRPDATKNTFCFQERDRLFLEAGNSQHNTAYYNVTQQCNTVTGVTQTYSAWQLCEEAKKILLWFSALPYNTLLWRTSPYTSPSRSYIMK